jgi:hypothetical protein
MNWGGWIAGAVLAANAAVVAADLRLFLWNIQGLEDPKGLVRINVTPTPLGLVIGLDVRVIAIRPSPTRDDPNPRVIEPLRSEVTSRFGRDAWFNAVGRRFYLVVSFRDGSTRTIDPWGPSLDERLLPPGRLRLLTEIAGQVKRG